MRAVSTPVVVVLLAFGCTDEEGSETSAGSAPASAVEQKAKKEVDEAVEAVKTLASEKATEFRRVMNTKLSMLDQRLDELKKKAEQAAAAGKAELKEQMQAVAEKRKAVQTKLDELGTATEAAWADAKSGLEDAYEDLERAIGEAAAHFDDAGESGGGEAASEQG